MKTVARSVAGLSLALSLSGTAALASVAPAGAGVRPATISADYTCSIPALGESYSGAVNISGQPPATATLKSKVFLTGVQLSVTVPASLVNELIGFGVTKVSGTATTVDFTATDATVATVNAATTPRHFGPIRLVANQALTIALPKQPAKIGSWRPSAAGTMTFSTGTVVFTTEGATVTCTPTAADTLGSTTVS